MNLSQTANTTTKISQKKASISNVKNISSLSLRDECNDHCNNNNRDQNQSLKDLNNSSYNLTSSEGYSKHTNMFDYTGMSIFFKDKSQANQAQSLKHNMSLSLKPNSELVISPLNSKIESLNKSSICYINPTINDEKDSIIKDQHHDIIGTKLQVKKKSSAEYPSNSHEKHDEANNQGSLSGSGSGNIVSSINTTDNTTSKEISILHKPSRNVNLDEKIIERIKSKVKPKSTTLATTTTVTTITHPNTNLSSINTIGTTTTTTTATTTNSTATVASASSIKGVSGVISSSQDNTIKTKTLSVLVAEKVVVENVVESVENVVESVMNGSEKKKKQNIKPEEKKTLAPYFVNQASFYASSPIIFDFKDTEIYADGHETKANHRHDQQNQPHAQEKVMFSQEKAIFSQEKSIFSQEKAIFKQERSIFSQEKAIFSQDKKKNYDSIGKIQKGDSEEKSEIDKETDTLVKNVFNPINRPLFLDLEGPFSTPRIDANQPSSTTSSQPKANAISNSSSFFIDDLNTNLLTDWIWKQTPTEKGYSINKFKPNVSVLSAESTFDSENVAANHAECNNNNNSFTTPFGASLNTSGKFDFSSPRYIPDGWCDPNVVNPYIVHSQANRNNFNLHAQKLQQLFSNTGRITTGPPNLNHSCINILSGNSFSDHSSSFSHNNAEDISGFGNNGSNGPNGPSGPSGPGGNNSTYATPQGRQQQGNLINAQQNQSFSYMPNDNIIDQYYLHSNQGMGLISKKFPEILTYNHTPSSSSNTTATTTNCNNNTGKIFMSMSAQAQMNYKSNSRLNKKPFDQDDSSLIYDIDVNKLVDPRRTTLMIKNIPNKYDRNLILQTIDKNHKGKYDFFYLPIDFRNRCNVGYAFINFIDIKFIKSFYDEFNGKRWEKFNSEKICELKYARIQGRAALIQHFQFSSVMNQQDKKLKPLILPNQNLSNIEQLVKQQKAELENDLQQ